MHVTDTTNGLTFPRIDCTAKPPTGVTIDGPGTGLVNLAYPFTATVSPITATQPLTVEMHAVVRRGGAGQHRRMGRQGRQMALERFDEDLPDAGSDAADIVRMLSDYGSPATVSQIGGRYFGFVNGGVVPAGLAARWLSDFWDQNSALGLMSPITSKLEEVCETWLKQLLGLSDRVVAGFVVAALLYVFLWRTKYGKLIRATAHSDEMVMALGRNTKAIYAIVFGIGCLMAGLGGALAAPIRSIYSGMGTDVVVECFIVVVVGGMGSIPGAFLAAIVIGFVRAFGIIGFPLIEEALIFILMAIVLIVRPQGFFGRAEL